MFCIPAIVSKSDYESSKLIWNMILYYSSKIKYIKRARAELSLRLANHLLRT